MVIATGDIVVRIVEVVIGSVDILGHVPFEGLGVIAFRFADYTLNPKPY